MNIILIMSFYINTYYLNEFKSIKAKLSCCRYFFMQPTYWCGKDYKQIYRESRNRIQKKAFKQNMVGDEFGGKILFQKVRFDF